MSLKKPLPRPKRQTKRERDLSLLREACEAAELEMIRACLRLPMHKRTNFLRVRIPGAPNGGTAL